MNKGGKMLADILIKTPEQKIFSLFVMNPDRPFYLREISKRLNISLGATHGALSALEKAQTLAFRTIGKTKLFELAAQNSPAALNSFRVLNTVLILEPLVELLQGLSKTIILYGSYAKGTFTQESDLDLFIVSDEREAVLSQLNDFLRNIEIDIRPVIEGQVEWIDLEKTDPEFFREVTDGLSLWEEQVSESGF
jgi:predicted nucleotidyltransferase